MKTRSALIGKSRGTSNVKINWDFNISGANWTYRCVLVGFPVINIPPATRSTICYTPITIEWLHYTGVYSSILIEFIDAVQISRASALYISIPQPKLCVSQRKRQNREKEEQASRTRRERKRRQSEEDTRRVVRLSGVYGNIHTEAIKKFDMQCSWGASACHGGASHFLSLCCCCERWNNEDDRLPTFGEYAARDTKCSCGRLAVWSVVILFCLVA